MEELVNGSLKEETTGQQENTPEPETGQAESTLEAPAAETTEEPQETAAEEPAATDSDPSVSCADSSPFRGAQTGIVTPAVVTPTPTLLTAENNDSAEEQESDEEYNTLNVNELDIVKLGRQGEHETQDVVIDCTAWLERLPGCALMIAAIRPGENEIYLPTVDVEDGVITWIIRDTDTAKGGWGRGEVRAMKDGKIKKSAVFRTRVEPSLEGGGGTPATPPDWVQEILEAVQASQEAAEAAAANAAQAELNTRGLAGWSLTREADGTVSIGYEEESESEG